jgi:hypothetical protein
MPGFSDPHSPLIAAEDFDHDVFEIQSPPPPRMFETCLLRLVLNSLQCLDERYHSRHDISSLGLLNQRSQPPRNAVFFRFFCACRFWSIFL